LEVAVRGRKEKGPRRRDDEAKNLTEVKEKKMKIWRMRIGYI
jgi:hypothetical protein